MDHGAHHIRAHDGGQAAFRMMFRPFRSKPSRAQGARPMLQPTRKIGHRSMPAAYMRTGEAAAREKRHAGRIASFIP